MWSFFRASRLPSLGLFALLALPACGDESLPPPEAAKTPILFVTQTPFHTEYGMRTAVFGNHKGGDDYVPRGGDLRIVYPDGKLRNLTEEAGFGLKRDEEIAVREPAVSWDGTRALFSMVIGGTRKDDLTPVFWQIYEVSGLGEDESVHIERVPNQPESFNNVSPAYGTDGRILFTTDRPRSGEARLYPQLDEYESIETNTGLWSFDPAAPGGDLRLLSHVPSGAFSPRVALDGRVIYVRWDHLQRDQQWHAERIGEADYGTFDFLSETSDEHGNARETFPEWGDADETPAPYHRHIFNQFFPWQINEDGSEEETVNHVGRQEMVGYAESARDDLPYYSAPEGRPPITNFLHVAEDPAHPGTFYGIDSPEFGSHSSGSIVAVEAPLGKNADDMSPIHVTDPVTFEAPEAGSGAPDGHDGRYRNPVPLSDGTLIAVHSRDPHAESQHGDGPFGNETYKFRLFHMVPKEGTKYLTAGAPLTPGITKKVTYFSNLAYAEATYDGEMWELDPVEVAPRPMPAGRTFEVPTIERGIIDSAMTSAGGYDALRAYLKEKNLALVISRNVTRRQDMQQPYNLAIPSGASTVEAGKEPELIQFIQFFQADQLRAYAKGHAGRRPVPREMHDAPDGGEIAAGAYKLAADGSYAALVPAGRAMSWQLLSPINQPVVRERYWVTFAPGEIRVCPNCHGINRGDVVLGEPAPTNPPQALAPFVKSLFQ